MHHEKYIRRTLQLAAKARGLTGTNPMVGAILVRRSDGAIVAEGYHRAYGKPHAEADVVLAARRKGIRSFNDMTLYVNLEPCCHQGKTPPCTDLIIREGIPHVVFGTVDPFPAVSGRGLQKLRRQGVEVEHGFLEASCRELNKVFFKNVRSGLPFVTLKLAQSLDGRIATLTGDSKWITGEPARRLVHRMRALHDAVMVGANTVITDDPSLTLRYVRGRQPWRVVVDRRLRVPTSARIFNDAHAQKTIVVTGEGAPRKKLTALETKGVQVVTGAQRLRAIFRKLRREFGIASILVEGGADFATGVLRDRLADELCIFIAPKLIGRGLSGISDLGVRNVRGSRGYDIIEVKRVGEDLMIKAEPK